MFESGRERSGRGRERWITGTVDGGLCQETLGPSAGSLCFLARILELLPQLGLERGSLEVVIRGFRGTWHPR